MSVFSDFIKSRKRKKVKKLLTDLKALALVIESNAYTSTKELMESAKIKNLPDADYFDILYFEFYFLNLHLASRLLGGFFEEVEGSDMFDKLVHVSFSSTQRVFKSESQSEFFTFNCGLYGDNRLETFCRYPEISFIKEDGTKRGTLVGDFSELIYDCVKANYPNPLMTITITQLLAVQNWETFVDYISQGK